MCHCAGGGWSCLEHANSQRRAWPKIRIRRGGQRQCSGKIQEAITVIDNCLQQQEQRGSQYLVGDSLTAADIYWATMSMSITDTPPDIMPVTKQNQGMLKFFAQLEIAGSRQRLSQRILDHQHYILTTYCETPAVLGGDPL